MSSHKSKSYAKALRGSSETRAVKRPFDIDIVLDRIEKAIRPFPKAALFGLKAQGYDKPFQQLVACVISVRTLDEVTLEVAPRVLAKADTPQKLLELDEEALARLLVPATFPGQKSASLRAASRSILDRFGGKVPRSFEKLITLPGIGPKCAALILGVAWGEPVISVDIHVHRVTNRWGYISGATPEKTLAALKQNLPTRHWGRINRLLVPFGKHICLGRAPRCSTCPVLEMCRQVGVKSETDGALSADCRS